MEIANPIYDVVFKYLMEDEKVAKIFLSALTQFDIVSLDFLPQELYVPKKAGTKGKKSILSSLNLSIYRLDFSAKIKDDNGQEKIVIIEIQKSKFTHENIRFRKYLGKQYLNENFYEWLLSTKGRKYKSGLPILPIYIMGEKMEGYEEIPVIKIGKSIKDRYTNKELAGSHYFINSLFHDGIIVNIPALSVKRRDDVEILLSIFDQKNRTENHHIMNVKETDFPEKFRPLIRRLQTASQVSEVRDIMTVEDDFLAEINEMENETVEERKLKEEERKLKEEERKLKEEAIDRNNQAVKLLILNGISKEIISKSMKLSLQEIERIEKL